MLLLNRIALTPAVSTPQSRSDLLGIAAAGFLALYAAGALELPTRRSEAVRLTDGVHEECFHGAGTSAHALLRWFVDACFTACPFVSSVFVIERRAGANDARVLARCGVVKRAGIDAIDLRASSVLSAPRIREQYYADMRVVPARHELTQFLPGDTQATLILPAGCGAASRERNRDDGESPVVVVVVGCNKVRPFTEKDMAWMRHLARALVL